MSLRKKRRSDVMAASKNMSDAELRKELKKLGVSPGPITDSTRGVYKKKLENLKANAAKSQKTRRSEGGGRSRRREPLEDDGGDWDEDEEEERTIVTARPTHKLERNSCSGNGRSESADDGFHFASKSITSHVGDTGLGRSDRSFQAGGLLSRSNADHLGLEHSSSLGGDRLSRTSYDYSGNLAHENRSSLASERYARNTSDYGGYLGQGIRSSLGGERFLNATSDYGGYLGQGTRSSLGGERFLNATSDYGSLGQETRSSLGGERYTRNTTDYIGYQRQEPRSTLGGERFTRDASDYGGYLGQESRSSLGGERFSKTTSDYGSLGQEHRSLLGGERFTRSPAEYGGYLGQALRSRSISERSGCSAFPTNGEDRPWDAKGHLSHKNYPVLSRGKPLQSKPNWSKTLEYYLSKLLWSLSVGLLIVFFGILIMKSGIFYSTRQDDLKLIPPDCEGKDDKYCQAMQKQIILQILSELYNFLSLEAGSFECGNPSGLSSKCIPIKRAKENVMNVFDHAPEKFDSALDWLLDRNEHLGIWPKSEDGEIATSRSLIFCVESSRPLLGITCRLTNALYTAISNLFLALFGVFVLWLFLIYLRYHWKKLEEEEKQMFAMVERIIAVVKRHYKDYQQGIEQSPFIGVLHVRDSLIMPQDRKRVKKTWEGAVQFVEDNESRLRTESQRVAGADLRVWRWTQTRHDISS
ncbi:LEM domain-containing protein 2 isoform 2-T2 [Mantella aurantiaca]